MEQYKITETTSLEDIQQQHPLRWLSYVKRSENNAVIKMLTLHTTAKIKLGRKIIINNGINTGMLEKKKILDFRNLFFLKIFFKNMIL